MSFDSKGPHRRQIRSSHEWERSKTSNSSSIVARKCRRRKLIKSSGAHRITNTPRTRPHFDPKRGATTQDSPGFGGVKSLVPKAAGDFPGWKKQRERNWNCLLISYSNQPSKEDRAFIILSFNPFPDPTITIPFLFHSFGHVTPLRFTLSILISRANSLRSIQPAS
jgi:hypothetical protein